MVLDNLSRLARAVESNWCTAWASLGAVYDELPTYVDDTPDYLRVFTPAAPEMLLNIVLRYAGSAPVTARDLEAVVAPYRRNRLPFQWWLMLGDEPASLRDELRRLDLQSCGGATCMALPLDDWDPPAGVPHTLPAEAARQVATRDDARAALTVICDVFYVPPGPMARWTTDNAAFTIYLTQVDGVPACALATLRHGATVGVYHVATLPGYRRRGLAGRLLVGALREARAAGCRVATLTATPEARRLYESLGFRACGVMEQWVPGPDLMARLTYGGRPPHMRGGGWW
jgi:GNAT superfamily N-acetyltransferase